MRGSVNTISLPKRATFICLGILRTYALLRLRKPNDAQSGSRWFFSPSCNQPLGLNPAVGLFESRFLLFAEHLGWIESDRHSGGQELTTIHNTDIIFPSM
jgi:hypothetical protein